MPALELDFQRAVATPFPGLRAFEPRESFLFFGRRAHTEELVARLATRRFLAVVGTSGSGKSSLVRAGLLPALYRGHLAGAGSCWRVAVMRPGDAPLDRLAEVLAEEDVLGVADAGALRETLGRSSLGLVQAVRQSKLGRDSALLVVDQFEELFRFQQTAKEEGAEAALFVQSLLEASDQLGVPIYVVLTMRSDFLGDCARFPGLPEALNDSQYLIPRLTREQRQEAIEGPLRLAQVAITSRLVQRLLNDAGDEPDQLPVIQHALMQTFHEADGGGLDLQHYERAGTMQRALNQHAEAVYEQLASDAHRRMAEKVFRGLTTFQQGRAVRRPATVQHLYDITGASSDVDRDLVRSVVRAFAARKCSFLLSSHGESLRPESVIDISHESLIRKWRRLRGWVSEEARSAEFYRDVSRDTALHEKGDAGLWRGKKLAGALKYVNSGEWNEAWAGQYERGDGSRFQPSVAFLHASRKRERFLFGSIVGLVLLLMFALAWGGVSSVRQRQVEERVREVEERAASLLAQAEEAQGRAVDASKTAEELRQIADRLQSAGGERVGEIQRLNEQIDRLQAESEKYKEVAGTAREQAEDVQQKGAPVRQETDPVSARRIAELDEQLQRAQSESSGLRDQLAAARAKVADLESAPKMKDTAALAIGDARALEASTAVGPLDKLSAWQKVLALSTAAADARKEAEERISFWQGHVDSWFLDRVQAGDIDSARQGLAAGAAPNAKDANSVTALMWAAENGHLDVVRALVQAGADVNSRDRSNFTALRRAERRGRGEIVRYLKSVGAR